MKEKEIAYYWYMKGVRDAETTERQPVSSEQTMKDFETHFYLQYKSLASDGVLADVSVSLPRNKRTKKTNETETFVDHYIKENGYPPTYTEIVDRFNLKSTSAAYARCRHFRHKMKRQ